MADNSSENGKRFFQRYRLIKTLLGLGMLGLGVWGVLGHFVMIRSVNAFVVAPIVRIRAQSEGVLSHDVALPGQLFESGHKLGVVRQRRNEAVEEIYLSNLQLQLSGLEAELEALATLKDALNGMTVGLKNGTFLYDKQRVAYWKARLSQVNARLEAERAKEQESKSKMERAAALSNDGLVSTASVQERAREKVVATSDLASTELELEVTKTALASAQQGMSLDQGGSERPYSKQRLDDVNLRVAVLERELHEKRLSYTSLTKRISSEQQRLSENRETPLVIPSRGRVWKVRAAKNEFVEKNDVVMELVDCSRMTVLTWVNERNFNRIHVADAASLEMSGSGKQYSGKVVQLFGRMAAGGADMDLAIQNEMLESKSNADAQRFVVLVAFDGLEKGNNCEIGQTGSVTFRPR